MVLAGHLLAVLTLRQTLVLPLLVRPLPAQRQSTRLLLLDFILFVGAGISVGLFHNLVWGFPIISGLELTIGFATIGLFTSLDLSLDWEYRIIRDARHLPGNASNPETFLPQTRRFAWLATGIIFFVTLVLLLILARDVLWLQAQDQAATHLGELLRSVVMEVLYVMGTLLVLTLTLVFSYARNLKILFDNQTNVLEQVSRGNLLVKVPVITNDEFAVIAGHTNAMIDRLVEREQMAQGLELARQIQANLLPSSSPYLPGVQVYGASMFCDETGGDFFDYMIRSGPDGEEMVIIIGDVTGHGVGSSLLMTSVRAYMKALLLQPFGLAEVLTRTNAFIHADMDRSGHFITAYVLSWNPRIRRATWVSAGHDPAWFLAAPTGPVRTLAGRDIPLGVNAGWRYEEFSEVLGSGLLVLGTDGIWEAGAGQGEMFGKDRLLDVLFDGRDLPPEALAGRVFESVSRFTQGAPVEDDRTVVIARLA